MDTQIDKREVEIDLKQLLTELLKRLWVILLVTGIAAIGALIVTMFFMKPTYQSTTTVYILSKQAETAVSYADLQTATQLTSDYEQLVKSRYVLDTVIADLGLGIESSKLAPSIAVTSPTGTRILEITVTNADPYTAQKIANKVRDVAGKQIIDIMDIDAVNLIDTANLPLTPASPSKSRNTIIGGLLGFLLTCAAIIAMYVLNDTIRTPEDVERYLGLSVLGVIPSSEEKKGGYGKKQNSGKKGLKK